MDLDDSAATSQEAQVANLEAEIQNLLEYLLELGVCE